MNVKDKFFYRLSIITPLLISIGSVVEAGGNVTECSEDVDSSIIAQAPIEAFFSAFSKGEMDEAFSNVDTDVVWTYHGPEDVIPFGGVFKGVDGVKDFFNKAKESIEILDMNPQTMVSVGSKVFSTGYEKSRVLSTNKIYKAPWVHVWTVCNGKITSFDEHIDSAKVLRSFQ